MKSQLSRNKKDFVDAVFIRYYCELLSPSVWKPLPPEAQELQALVKRHDTLKSMILQETNRLEKVQSIIADSIIAHIEYLKKESKSIESRINIHIQTHSELKKNSDLLKSIPGVGQKTISKTLAFFGDATQFAKAKQMAAFVGLNPQHAQSGTSLNHSHISKTGDANLRKMFYMPALVAIRHEPSIQVFYEKLVSKGKAKKLAICAVMRKLVHIIYGVLNSGEPFNPKLIYSH